MVAGAWGSQTGTAACHACAEAVGGRAAGVSLAGGHQISPGPGQSPGCPHKPLLQMWGSTSGAGASAMLLPSGRIAGLVVETSWSACLMISLWSASLAPSQSFSTSGVSGNQARPWM